jgi:hypothetical protein
MYEASAFDVDLVARRAGRRLYMSRQESTTRRGTTGFFCLSRFTVRSYTPRAYLFNGVVNLCVPRLT